MVEGVHALLVRSFDLILTCSKSSSRTFQASLDLLNKHVRKIFSYLCYFTSSPVYYHFLPLKVHHLVEAQHTDPPPPSPDGASVEGEIIL